MYPLKDKALIQKTGVEVAVVLDLGSREEAIEADTVVERDQDHVLARRLNYFRAVDPGPREHCVAYERELVTKERRTRRHREVLPPPWTKIMTGSFASAVTFGLHTFTKRQSSPDAVPPSLWLVARQIVRNWTSGER